MTTDIDGLLDAFRTLPAADQARLTADFDLFEAWQAEWEASRGVPPEPKEAAAALTNALLAAIRKDPEVAKIIWESLPPESGPGASRSEATP